MIWQDAVRFYPAGVLVGPDEFHEGPTYFYITKTGWYRWDLCPAGWSMIGPINNTGD